MAINPLRQYRFSLTINLTKHKTFIYLGTTIDEICDNSIEIKNAIEKTRDVLEDETTLTAKTT